MSAYGYTEDCIGYGVELSTRKANFRPRGRRPLTDALAAILALIPAFKALDRDAAFDASVPRSPSEVAQQFSRRSVPQFHRVVVAP